jgi:hypothetical protein
MCGRFMQHYTWAQIHEFLSVIGAPPPAPVSRRIQQNNLLANLELVADYFCPPTLGFREKPWADRLAG